MKKIRFSALFILILFTGSAASQEIRVTLKEAIQHAYNNDPNIAKINYNIDAQESNIRARYGNLFPDLKFSTGWTRSNQVLKGGSINQNGITIPVPETNETSDNFSLSLRSDVTLFDGMTSYDQIDLAKLTKKQYQLQLKKAKTGYSSKNNCRLCHGSKAAAGC